MYKRFIFLLIITITLFSCAQKNTEWTEQHILELAAAVPTVGNPLDFDMMGANVFMAEDQGGLSIINLNDYTRRAINQIVSVDTDTLSLIKISRVSVVPTLNRLFINEREGSDEIRVVDISDLDSMIIRDRISGGTQDIQDMKFTDISGSGSQFDYEGYYCLGGTVSYGKYGVHYASFPPLWAVLKNYSTSAINGAVFSSQYVFAAAEQRGLAIFDRSSEARIGECDLPGEAQKVKLSGNYAYLACRQSGLQIVDVSNPTAPVMVGSYDTSGYATNLDIWNNYLVMSSGGGGIYLFDITNPTNPVLLDNITSCGYVNNVKFHNGKVLVAGRDQGLLIYNLVP
jgi:hypothetical protein